MNIKRKILRELAHLPVPVYFMTNFNANEDTYIVFFIENTKPHASYENEETAIKYEIMLHIYSRTDYDELAETVVALLKEANFKRRYEAEDYDDTTQFYIKAIKLDYIHYIV